MQHRVKGRILSRRTGQRQALLKTLLGSLIMRERIVTTEAKAKELKNHIDQLINKGKRSAVAEKTKRQAILRDIRTRLSAEATQKISGEFTKRFDARKSGYVRVVKLDARKGDGAKMAVIEFV